MKSLDVLIIGAGSAGLSARREVAKKTDNYLVADPGILGTTCARVGCMPSKVLIQVAEDFFRRHSWNEEGIFGGKDLHVDSKLVMKHVRKLRDRFVRGVTSSMQSWEDEKLVKKRASFVDSKIILLGDEKITAKKVIIATGSTPVIPKEFQDYKSFLITTDNFFELEELPKSIAVIGTGVIGMELGQALSRLDIETMVIGRRRNICHVTDPELNEYVCSKFEKKMNVNFSGVESISTSGELLVIKLKDGKEFSCEKVLMTAGRKPNLASLKLENAGISLNEKGLPEINEKTMRVKNSNLYFAGDITGTKQILHEASDEGRVAGYNSVRVEDIEFNFRTSLEIAFSDPNIAFIGKKFEELEKANIDFSSGKVLFEGQGRSIIKLKEEGMLKIYGENKSGKLLGCELYAPDGEHLAHLISWAIESGLTVQDLLSYPFYHPVVEEGLRTALRSLLESVEVSGHELEIIKKT